MLDKETINKLKQYNQEHIIDAYNLLTEDKKIIVENQLKNIDFELITELYNLAKEGANYENVEIEPIDYIDRFKMPENEANEYIKRGIEAIKDKEFAVVTMAGGQGTRLGHNGPKGTYKFGKNNKSIFEMLCDHLKEAVEKYNTFINWYIMTSDENYQETIDFFEENNYFDYPKNYITFFKQGKLPMVDFNGKLIMSENQIIKEGADGHGGTINTLQREGILKKMQNKGIKWVFISGVDNVLAELVDPLFLGLTILNGAGASVKSVSKTNPKEKAGVFCKKNGKVGVVEYSEITEDMANMRDNFGRLVYGDLNALLHIFSIDTLLKICDKKLPYHTAKKKAKYLDRNGKLHIPEKENAYKFESFIFDALELIPTVPVLRVQREDEFAPLKNSNGEDSPETAGKLYNDNQIKKISYDRYYKWLHSENLDSDIKRELKEISGNEVEIRDRFYKELDFGTAGLRGIMGAGTNRMNKYVVSKATQGLANYILNHKLSQQGVVIFYDTRRNSQEFAQTTALIMNANNIKTYVITRPTPVPILSYSVRRLHAAFGIMITASHNPPEYNGYKVYDQNGIQINTPVDKEIIEEVRKIKRYSEVKMMEKEVARKSKLYVELGESIVEDFVKEIQKLGINTDKLKEERSKLKLVYTPLHGTGLIPVKMILSKLGYDNVYTVAEQEFANGYFPTLISPNPEEESAFDRAKILAKEVDADVLIATDPDADRLGVMLKNHKGEFTKLTGNQIGTLILEYILSQKKQRGELKENSAAIGTIVSTKLTKKIAEKYGVKYFETLTGFKHIGTLIKKFEDEKNYTFVFGFEESFGFLSGLQAKDKDSINALMLMLEILTYNMKNGKTLLQKLDEIYKEYGYFVNSPVTITLKGESGEEKIKKIMENLRNEIPRDINGIKVVEYRDYKTLKAKNFETGDEYDLHLPNSNVIYLQLENDSFIAIRPSGTEPKIKIYIEASANTYEKAKEKVDKIKEFISRIEVKPEENKLNFKESKIKRK